MIVTPAQRSTTVLPADAVILAVGALASLGSYLLPWYRSVDRPSLWMSGLGTVNDPTFVVASGRLNWMVAAAALGALVLGAARLSGRTDPAWRRVATVTVALAVAGALFDLVAAPDGMAPTHGVMFAAAGAAIVAAGGLVCRRRIDGAAAQR